MSDGIWRLPIDAAHSVAGRAGKFVFVGGAGDFDPQGQIRHPDDLGSQIVGTLDNIAAALGTEDCTLEDVVRFKVFYRSDSDQNEWEIVAAIQNRMSGDPAPAITANPVPFQPFVGQAVQIQVIAQREWRRMTPVRKTTRSVPAPHAHLFESPLVTTGLRAGEFISVPGRTAAEHDDSIASADPIVQTHRVMQGLEASLKELGASLQDAVKMEGLYFGNTISQWAPLAATRANYFREPGPVATTVPCHILYPRGALTKVELLAMRDTWNGFDKYIPRDDSWPRRVWDWPMPLPYRQGLRLRDTIWTGGQVPHAPSSNSGKVVLPGQLQLQTHFSMRYIVDILRSFKAVSSDLALLVCYFASRGTQPETEAFLRAVADCVSGPLPPITVVPQPSMHSADTTVEIWGVARA